MGEDRGFPTTQDYTIGVNVNLRHPSLKQRFFNATTRRIDERNAHDFIEGLLGRSVDGIKIERSSKFQYDPRTDTFEFDPALISISHITNTPKWNLPPVIPRELTPELLVHLFGLHEAEHATQHSGKVDPNTKKRDPSSIFSTYIKPGVSSTDTKARIMDETDADLPIYAHLNDLGLKRVAQFWQDARTVGSFVNNIPFITDKGMYHDTSALTRYYQQTGKVIDVNFFMTEKKGLLEKIRSEMGLKENDFAKVFQQYGVFKNAQAMEYLNTDEGKRAISVRPQIIMQAVKGLLDKGALTGLQKWEAENYMAAMGRLGYKPEKTDCIAQLRTFLEKTMGLKREENPAVGAKKNIIPKT